MDAEHAIQRVDIPDPDRFIADRLELLCRRQQQLLDDEPRNFVEESPRLQRERRELRLEPGEFRPANRLEMLTHRDKRCAHRCDALNQPM